jgi:hypothetical protein
MAGFEVTTHGRFWLTAEVRHSWHRPKAIRQDAINR